MMVLLCILIALLSLFHSMDIEISISTNSPIKRFQYPVYYFQILNMDQHLRAYKYVLSKLKFRGQCYRLNSYSFNNNLKIRVILTVTCRSLVWECHQILICDKNLQLSCDLSNRVYHTQYLAVI